jgi:hypothetical protein
MRPAKQERTEKQQRGHRDELPAQHDAIDVNRDACREPAAVRQET